MKKNDLAEIKKLETKAIKERVLKAQFEIKNLILDKNTGKLTNLKAVKSLRKDLAQLKTVLNQKLVLEKLEKEATNA